MALLHAALCQGPIETALLPNSPGLAAMGAEAAAAVLVQVTTAGLFSCIFLPVHGEKHPQAPVFSLWLALVPVLRHALCYTLDSKNEYT